MSTSYAPTRILAYREFYDIPRAFVIEPKRRCLLFFDCPFDERLDDYPGFFDVYLLHDLSASVLPQDWRGLSARAVGPLGRVMVTALRFDETRRREVAVDGLPQLVFAAESLRGE